MWVAGAVGVGSLDPPHRTQLGTNGQVEIGHSAR
jgi:hypothetical protein